MTEREKVILLAERVMDWFVMRPENDRDPAGVIADLIVDSPAIFVWRDPCNTGAIWNPFASISDAYELEAALPENKREEYIGWLECECVRGGFDSDNPQHEFAIVHATPAQRSNAALAAIDTVPADGAQGGAR